MMTRTFARGAVVTVTLLGSSPVVSPAWAGGIGDFLSPAFGTSCANHNTAARAEGTTTQGTGAANGNLAGLPIGSPMNQCGGADLKPKFTDPDDIPLYVGATFGATQL